MVAEHVLQYRVPQPGGQRHQVVGERVTAQLEQTQTDHLRPAPGPTGRGGGGAATLAMEYVVNRSTESEKRKCVVHIIGNISTGTGMFLNALHESADM